MKKIFKNKIIKNNFLILLSEIIFLLFYILIQTFLPTCPFRKIFNMPCPFCNGRHAVNALLKFDIISSLKYNILVLPLVIFFIIFDIVLIVEMLTNKEISRVKKMNKKILTLIIILLLILSLVYNLITFKLI